MKFSDRYGYTDPKNIFQRERVDDDLRVKLWNILKVCIWDNYDHDDYSLREKSQAIDYTLKRLWIHYFNNDLDDLPGFRGSYHRRSVTGYEYLKEYFFTCHWYEVFNFLEALLRDRSRLIDGKALEWINDILEDCNSAYRVVDEYVAEITAESEIIAIEEALTVEVDPVRQHLTTALKMLSDRENKDLRNSVKESISAVEAMSREITGNRSATLGEALKKIKNCHPALQQGFLRIYGYTSDESGVRHALSDESVVSYSDAKFMLVACSAFVSYLRESMPSA